MKHPCRGAGVLILALLLGGCTSPPRPGAVSGSPAGKAIGYLLRETPAWRRENGCFSCHNNGDAARALFAASRRGYAIPQESLADTVQWLTNPWAWDKNKGDPGFNDRKLADIQFASALLAALESGWAGQGPALAEAVMRLLADQAPDGSWQIEGQSLAGAPVTYGPALATSVALGVLQASGMREARPAIELGKAWLHRCQPSNALVTAILMAGGGAPRSALTDLLRRVQTPDGGWGPFEDSPPEPFDTSIVLLALVPDKARPEVSAMIAGGRNFLAKTQNPDGSWPPTTRPPGGRSYAHQVSTTAWAALALLATENSPSPKSKLAAPARGKTP